MSKFTLKYQYFLSTMKRKKREERGSVN